jgi:hypothetical protein
MRLGVALVAAMLVAAAAAPAAALDWGGLAPGMTTMEQVRTLYGQPTRTRTEKVEGFDTTEWVYEGPKAPAGIRKLTVEFGMKIEERFRPGVVRAVRLEPKPGAFNRSTVLTGWGRPSMVKTEEGRETAHFFAEGLVVYYDKDGWTATMMLFTPPQPLPAAPPEKKP